MLYLLGAVALQSRGLSADAMERTGVGGLVAKPVMGGLQRKEATGEGEADITLTGTLLPSRIGGMTELETLDAMRRNNARFPLMRGDGYAYGWYAIKELSERHEELERDGVGFIVSVRIVLEQADPLPGDGQQVISGLLSLFGALGF